MTRTFEDREAVREQTPLLIGLIGPSGSGKTFSALRLATGIQKVAGGEVGYIDTEARRALHYADQFKFRHVDFRAPFGPLDYLAAVEHLAKKGIKTIIIDSMSHEHEGPGGVLEMHASETTRLVEQWRSTPDKVKMSAWQEPKKQRRRLINSLLQMPINFIFCFRAKEKVDLTDSKKPKTLGWMPIAGEEFVYEQTVNILLYPNSGGVPAWHPEEMGEKAIVKCPEQLKRCFTGGPLSEATGEALARWAAGGSTPTVQAPGGEGAPGQDVMLPGPSDRAILTQRLTRDLKMSVPEAKAWLKRYFDTEATADLSGERLAAGLALAQVLIDRPQDDEAFSAVYEPLAGKRLVK